MGSATRCRHATENGKEECLNGRKEYLNCFDIRFSALVHGSFLVQSSSSRMVYSIYMNWSLFEVGLKALQDLIECQHIFEHTYEF